MTVSPTLTGRGDLELGLAPMEGVTDLAFRLWISLCSPITQCGTPFLRATASFPKGAIPRSFAPELSELASKVPYRLIPQVMAADPQDFIRCAKLLLEHAPYVDLNCGCPSPNAVGSRAGSSLLQDPRYFGRFVREISQELGAHRLSVKMRTGFLEHSELEDLVAEIGQLPLHHLTIHGRTRRQRYDGFARWALLDQAAQQLDFPLVVSGDIVSLSSLEALGGRYPRLRQVIIGRGALRNPWLFWELAEGRTQTITTTAIIYSLAMLACLYHLALEREGQLFAAAQAQLFLTPCGVHQDSWGERFRQLAEFHHKGTELEQLEFPPFVLGRVKMIWNYLRSSLPEPYFNPKILRSKSFGEMIARIRQQESQPDEALSLCHQPGLDWVYTSKKKSPADTDPLF